MVMGITPFYMESHAGIYRAVQKGKIAWPSGWGHSDSKDPLFEKVGLLNVLSPCASSCLPVISLHADLRGGLCFASLCQCRVLSVYVCGFFTTEGRVHGAGRAAGSATTGKSRRQSSGAEPRNSSSPPPVSR